jgi:hypothetical protein
MKILQSPQLYTIILDAVRIVCPDEAKDPFQTISEEVLHMHLSSFQGMACLRTCKCTTGNIAGAQIVLKKPFTTTLGQRLSR